MNRPLVKVWKTFANYIASTVSRKVTRALPQRWAKVLEMLSTYVVVLLQRNPGTLLKCWATAVKMFLNRHTWKLQKIVTTLRENCENVGAWSCCNIFQESFKSVATMFPQNVVWKHLHNCMATFIDNVEVLWYSQCCDNLSAIWENPRRKYQDML